MVELFDLGLGQDGRVSKRHNQKRNGCLEWGGESVGDELRWRTILAVVGSVFD